MAKDGLGGISQSKKFKADPKEQKEINIFLPLSPPLFKVCSLSSPACVPQEPVRLPGPALISYNSTTSKFQFRDCLWSMKGNVLLLYVILHDPNSLSRVTKSKCFRMPYNTLMPNPVSIFFILLGYHLPRESRQPWANHQPSSFPDNA